MNGRSLVLVLLVLSFAPPVTSGAAARKASQSGRVQSGDRPIPFPEVRVYRATAKSRRARLVGEVRGEADGQFTVRYTRPSKKDAVLYVVADGARPAKGMPPGPVRLASVLGRRPYPDSVVVNERTTVAAAYAMAQFIAGEKIGGPKPGLPNAAATVRNLVDLENGGIGAVLGSSPNGTETSALLTVNSLANMLASCVREVGGCSTLFALTTPPGGAAPGNTLDAMVNVAHDPGLNVAALLQTAQTAPVYAPALPSDAATNPDSPDYVNSFVLALRYTSAGPTGPVMDGPGNIAFDRDGNAWVNNNYAYGSSPDVVECGSTRLIKLTPTGGTPTGAPYGGNDVTQDGVGAGGLYGAGFGIAVDPKDHVWVTSFGFQGQRLFANSPKPDCANMAEVLAVSVSKFDRKGRAISPDGNPSANVPGGYPGPGAMKQPQGVKSDRRGDIWIAGCVDGTVTRFRGGRPQRADFMKVSDSPKVDVFDKGFDVAIDGRGHAWVTGNGSSSVVEINRKFKVVTNLSKGFDRPMGIASDSAGHLWVADAGLPNPPCPPALAGDPSASIGDDGGKNVLAAVTLIDTTGDEPTTTRFGKVGGNRNGLRWPWGIAVDGNDNVWVANFAGQRIMHMCGAKKAKCPPGKVTGDPISPDDGYFFNGFDRITAVQIDPSGNVWMTNNWILQGFTHPENPGGKQVVVFIGLAAPVRTPLLGPPRQPRN
jgi:hypothetical protein